MKSLPNISSHSVKFLTLGVLCAIATSSLHAQIFDVSTSSRNVFKYAAGGGASVTGTNPFISLNGYGSGVAYSNGDLFVSQTGNTGAGGDGANGQDVLEYNATTGAQVAGFSVLNLNNPQFMTVDGSTLFVANRTSSTGATGSIGAYNTTTGAGSTLINNLYQPTDVAAYNGNLYVSLNNGGGSGTNGTIEEFNETTGAQVMSFSIAGLSEPQGLAFANGNLYVTNEGTNQVFEYNLATDAQVGSVTVGTNPYGIATLANGDLVVTSFGPGSQAFELDPSLNVLSSNYLTGSSYSFGIAAATPEPTSWALGAVAGGLFVVLIRRRQLKS